MKWSSYFLGFGILLFVLALFGCSKEPEYSVDNNGVLHYPQDRGDINIEILKTEDLGNYTIQTLTFPTKGTKISALLYTPKNPKVGLVWIPAAGKRKVDAMDRGEAFASLGIATLIVDVRGFGDTQWQQQSGEEEYKKFSNGEEPYDHLVVYDALRSIDVMRKLGYKCVLLGGESNGGRISINSGAVDKSINGLLLMSTAGYGEMYNPVFEIRRYYSSINPDHYAPLLNMPVAFIHDKKDPTIPYDVGEKTYFKIVAEKKMLTISKGCHGYCPTMHDSVKQAFDYLTSFCAS